MAQVATPTITVRSGLSNNRALITLACATSGASIYYTTDGSTPDATSSLYSAAFYIYATATIKAIGIKAGSTDSVVAAVAVTIETAAAAGTPVAESILENLKNCLAAISTATGYHYTTGLATREAMDWNNLAPNQIPAAMPFSLPETDDETGANEQNVLAELNIAIRGVIYAETAIETAMMNWMQDIEKCVMVDGTRGGYAVSTAVRGKIPYENEKSFIRIFDLNIAVLYQYKHGNP